MKMNEKKLRELQQHVVAAQGLLKELLDQDPAEDEEVSEDRGDIGGSDDDDEPAPTKGHNSLALKLGKYKNA